MSNEIVVFYVTHPNHVHASKLTQTLIDESLIACGNIFPISSMYNWQNQFCQEEEYVSLLKTNIKLAEAVESRVGELHSYDVPCIIRTKFICNPAYAEWIKEQTKS